MAISSGSKILLIDYNTLQTDVNSILGTAPSTYKGYGQALQSYQLSTKKVETADWARLKIDILKIAGHQGLNANASIVALNSAVITAGTKIYASELVKFSNAYTAVASNTFLNVEFSDENFSPTISSSRTASWGGGSSSVTHTFTVDFGSVANATYFFNAGSAIILNASRTGGSSTTQNSNWSTMLSSMGSVIVRSTSTSASAGTGSSIGYYNLTTTNQLLFSTTGTGAYSTSSYSVYARSEANNVYNTAGNSRYMYFTVTFNDVHTNAFSDYVDGTLTSAASYRRASGSNVNVTAPTATTTANL